MIYLWLFLEFLKIGLFTFGGGYAMIPLIKETVLVNHQWLTESEFYDFIGVCESTPGPIAVNMATYVGSVQGGFLGSLVATFGVCLPSYVIILLVAAVLAKALKNRYVQGALNGLKPIVVGLILSAGITLAMKVFGVSNSESISFQPTSAIVFGVLFLTALIYRLIAKKNMNSILFILISAGVGIGVCCIVEAMGYQPA